MEWKERTMQFEKAFIPYGSYWSTPFCRWQGSLAHLHSIKFAAEVAGNALADRKIAPEVFDGLFLGWTVPQQYGFYGAPWVAGMIGAPGITGPSFSQACATSGRVIASAAMEIEQGTHSAILAVLCDRTSNSPHIYYPNPLGIGGVGDKEDWVWDNFSHDPFAKNTMVQTAENVAKKAGIDRAAQDEVALLRYEQYLDALKDDSAFLKRFMVTPLEVEDSSGRKVINTVEGDEGVFATTADGLAKLKPAMEGGTVTFGSQTYPADGNAGIIVTTKEKAAEISRDSAVVVRLVSFGQGRAEKGFMPMANVPASRQALDRAGISIKDIKAIKTHNPFAINDVFFARQMEVDVSAMNRFGSSLVWGHPQGPTGARLIMELIEELVLSGGGYGLFTGCAAGDTAFAVVVKVD
ncbi:MAG: thiolase family protein [Phycisphaerales bacterium]|nr:MAG: thiolase family protein [Phycisphaerales bacterium]